jgi:hypothetical protein
MAAFQAEQPVPAPTVGLPGCAFDERQDRQQVFPSYSKFAKPARITVGAESHHVDHHSFAFS